MEKIKTYDWLIIRWLRKRLLTYSTKWFFILYGKPYPAADKNSAMDGQSLAIGQFCCHSGICSLSLDYFICLVSSVCVQSCISQREMAEWNLNQMLNFRMSLLCTLYCRLPARSQKISCKKWPILTWICTLSLTSKKTFASLFSNDYLKGLFSTKALKYFKINFCINLDT